MLDLSKRVLPALILLFTAAGTAEAAFLTGDFNNDAKVNIADLSLLAQQWLSPPTVCAEPGLVGHWKLDEDQDITAADSSGNNRPGALNGGALWRPADGRIAGAIELDGVDDSIQITDYKGILGKNARTCAAWIRTTHTNVEIINWGDPAASGGRWSFGINEDGFLRLDVNGGYVAGSTYVNDDLWHHVAAASHHTDANSIELFVDGILEAVTDSKSHEIQTAAAANVMIGAPAGTGQHFKGRIDDVRIYDHYLGMDQLWALAKTDTTDTACVDIKNGDGIDLRDFALMAQNWLHEFSPILINEFLAGNDNIFATIEHVNGVNETVYPDWIELYNQTSDPIDISGWYLTDDEDDLTKWRFPEGTIIEAGAYLIVFASRKEAADHPDNYPYVDRRGYLHTNFKLTTGGEYLALTAPVPDQPGVATILHEYYTYKFDDNPLRFGYPPQDDDVSYGMFYNHQRYFGTPTPGAPNNNSFLGYVGDTAFSHNRGFYDGRIDLAITSKTPNAIIRYTLDGSTPNETDNGITYEGPITIDQTTTLRAMAFKPGWVPTNVDTQTYIFIDDVPLQSPNGEQPTDAWPDPSYRVNSQELNYGMDPDIVEDPDYAELIDDALLSLPAISIVTDLDNLFDKDKGIYVNARKHGIEWEKPASVELLYPDGGNGFHINAGLRIRGGFSRSGGNPKHAFRLFFRGRYGSPKLDFPLFGAEGVDRFDKVDFRTAQNYSWSFRGDDRNTMCREVFSRDMQHDMGQPYTRSRYYHLYLNGRYWGVFQTQERSEARYASSYFGGDVEDYDVVKVDAGPYVVEATDGDLEAFQRLWEACKPGFADDKAYYAIQGLNPDKTPNPEFEKLVDVDNLIDYMISTYYVGDGDSPISSFLGNNRPNNFYGIYDRRNPDGFKYFRHDGEHSLGVASRTYDRTGPHPAGSRVEHFNPQWLHQKLTANTEYRMRFGDRVHKYFFNSGLLTPLQATATFLERAERIDPAIIAESARWGDSKRSQPLTRDHWLDEINEIVHEYFPDRYTEDDKLLPGRAKIVLGQLREKDWYPSVEAPSFLVNGSHRHGGHISPADYISMTAPEGNVFYTLDGSDPRLGDNELRIATDVLVGQSAAKKVHVPTGPDDGFSNAPPPDVGHWKFDDNFFDASPNFNEGSPYGNVAFAPNRYGDERTAITLDGMDDYVYIPPPWDETTFEITEDITLACWVKFSSHHNLAGLVTKGESAWELSLGKEGDEGRIRFDLPDVGEVVSDDTLDDDQWHHVAGVRNRDTLTLYIDGEENVSLTIEDPNNSLIATNNALVFIGSNYERWWDEELGMPKPDRTSFEGLIDDVRIYSRALSPEEVKRLEQEGEFWPRIEYDDVSWRQGNRGVGYKLDNDFYEPLIGIDVEDQMHNENSTCCIRIPFNVADPEDIVSLTLKIKYDDGFVAYLNGEEIARENLQDEPQWNSTATDEIEDSDANQLTDFDVSEHLGLLVPGKNVLGILGLNHTDSDDDFLISAELLAGENFAISENAVLYTEPFTIEKSTHIKARTISDEGQLSALTEAVFAVGPVAENLRITEIMYHPTDDGPSEPNSEYIELVNIGEDPLNLNLVSFTDGVEFTFPDVVLEGGAHALLVRKWSAFYELYPDSNDMVIGQYRGSLDNAGEKTRLADAFGRTIHEFKYDDNWYDMTDGDGFSLTVRNNLYSDLQLLNEDLLAHWQFDAQSSAGVKDSSQEAHDGQIFGDAIFRPLRGKIDGALLLDGVDDYVEFTDFKGITGSRDRTCSAWIKTTAVDGQILAWGGSSSGAKWVIGIDSHGCLRVDVGGGHIAGATPVNDGKWRHIAVVLDGSATGDIQLYIDGQPDQPADLSSRSISTISAADVTIGVFGDSEKFFNGLIDDLRIYEAALDTAAIRTLSGLHNLLDGKKHWRPSAYPLGSPGCDDPLSGQTGHIPEPGDIRINEILAHADITPYDWVELHNTTDHTINIGNWFISDDNDDYRKFRIPAPTTVSAGGYIVFRQDQHFGNADHPGCTSPFALSENGETLHIRSADADGAFTGFYEEERFGPSSAEISFGRYYKQSTDTYNFIAMASQTRGAENSDPLVGPVVISAIMYNPPAGGDYDHNEYEYIELFNTSTTAAAPLYEYDNENQRLIPWRFTDGIDFEFPLGVVLQPQQHLLIVKNPTAFNERYGDTGVMVLGPWQGRLDNAGEKLTLSKPGDEVKDEYYYIRLDQVNFDNSLPWPAQADGRGSALVRITPEQYGNDPANWTAGDPYPQQ